MGLHLPMKASVNAARLAVVPTVDLPKGDNNEHPAPACACTHADRKLDTLREAPLGVTFGDTFGEAPIGNTFRKGLPLGKPRSYGVASLSNYIILHCR